MAAAKKPKEAAKPASAKATASQAAKTTKPAKGNPKPAAPAKKAWTVMVYLAGDNNLDGAGVTDLAEMKKTGSTERINVLAQFDRAGKNAKTTRYALRAGTPLSKDAVQTYAETNTGDPRVLIDFLTWGISTYPAERYMLVIWNHGAGWDDANLYATEPFAGKAVTHRSASIAGSRDGDPVPRAHVRAALVRGQRSLFATTVATAAHSRAIAFDDQAQDFLDNKELKAVLATAKTLLGRPIDVIGMDACLMAMAEVGYQVAPSASVFVGSQESEPGDGWPYDRILAALDANPAMDAAALGKEIVADYVASYPASEPVTQSAVTLTALTEVRKQAGVLGKLLSAALKTPTGLAALAGVRARVQEYTAPYDEYVDLHDLAGLLAGSLPDPAIKAACAAVQAAVKGAVLASATKGKTMAGSHGISIYFPKRQVSAQYPSLDFALRSPWTSFIRNYAAAVGKR